MSKRKADELTENGEDAAFKAAKAAAAAQDEEEEHKADDELDPLGMPKGWRQCPRMGIPIDRFIPMKVPLGAHFDNYLKEEDRFSVTMAKQMADAAVAGKTFRVPVAPDGEVKHIPAHVGLVVDLTKSTRYYNPQLWVDMGMRYSKIPCKGRGAAPEPEAVNEFVGEVMEYIRENPTGMILVHCTHGFNRTGYVIVCYLVRMLALTVRKAVEFFAKCRAPGIYKHYYIRQLFRYHHEGMPPSFTMPPIPEWKGGDSPEREEEDVLDGALGRHMHHEDLIGEGVSRAEYIDVVTFVIAAVKGECNWDGYSEPVFPGSQPVSLDRQNLRLLKEIRYWVTWKADGTRYMIALMRYGAYLVDRKFQVRRVQMRFPQVPQLHPQDRGKPIPVGPPHNGTLLDGEMVVDTDLEGNQTRRFLIYDLVALNREPLGLRPWKDRYAMTEDLVVKPRNVERHKIETNQWDYPYQYSKEPFRVRRKEFWPLPKADKLLNTFIPNLSHEADGLIFQPYYDTYESGTCPQLLKWKFPHMNSVDFQLRCVPGQPPQLLLLHPLKHRDYQLKPLEGAVVVFPEGDDPALHNHHIVECTYDHEQGAWLYMRTRQDKKLPNAYRVFLKVFSSIEDNITEGDILQEVEATLTLPLYDRDMRRGPGAGAAGQPPQPQRGHQGQHHRQQQQQQQHCNHHQPPAAGAGAAEQQQQPQAGGAAANG